MQLVSIRTQDEFMGLTSGYDYIKPVGDIPMSLWGHAGHNGDKSNMSDF